MTYIMNGILWTVRFVNSSSPLLMRSNNTMTIGMCDINRHEICLSDKLHGAMLRKVLIHEVTHSAMASYGIEMSIEQEEIFCSLVSTYGDEIFGVVDNLFTILRRIA